MGEPRIVGVRIGAEVGTWDYAAREEAQKKSTLTWHLPGVSSDWDTLCGMDASDDSIGHHGSVRDRIAGRRNKVTCPQCYAIFKLIKEGGYREAHFRPSGMGDDLDLYDPD